MKIPVFVSSPTRLSQAQEAQRETICRILSMLNLEPRALGRTDYPTNLPLREVMVIARHCSGGVILGFNQFIATQGKWKPGTDEEKELEGEAKFPTAWNHLEAGILFSMRRPLLVFKESGIAGGIFDYGVTDAFVHKMPAAVHPSDPIPEDLFEIFLKWRGAVGGLYYE